MTVQNTPHAISKMTAKITDKVIHSFHLQQAADSCKSFSC